jgi:hypothetical protein
LKFDVAVDAIIRVYLLDCAFTCRRSCSLLSRWYKTKFRTTVSKSIETNTVFQLSFCLIFLLDDSNYLAGALITRTCSIFHSYYSVYATVFFRMQAQVKNTTYDMTLQYNTPQYSTLQHNQITMTKMVMRMMIKDSLPLVVLLLSLLPWCWGESIAAALDVVESSKGLSLDVHHHHHQPESQSQHDIQSSTLVSVLSSFSSSSTSSSSPFSSRRQTMIETAVVKDATSPVQIMQQQRQPPLPSISSSSSSSSSSMPQLFYNNINEDLIRSQKNKIQHLRQQQKQQQHLNQPYQRRHLRRNLKVEFRDENGTFYWWVWLMIGLSIVACCCCMCAGQFCIWTKRQNG